jgi:S1-C subfamily serine protease
MKWQRRALSSAFFLLLGSFPGASIWAETPDWSETLERISSAVVSLKVDATRAFDTGTNRSGQATGFVVDAEQGLILTNRHVVTPGPVRAEALFLNQEEVELTAIYRDPVHDFGLFRYKPEDLNYLKPAELELHPEQIEVGLEVRIVGNDAGEQLSILSGIVARLDRQAPAYGFGNYNDFNTDYIQAASGSSGGSSGSPVIDIDGDVVALNAGASSAAASSFFLPLDRVKRAVDILRAGGEVTRGTLQTKFLRVAYDELQRLGLRPETEKSYRDLFPGQTGMLIVSEVMRGGVADSKLQIGDILLGINDREIANFRELEELFDDQVGETVIVNVERLGKPLSQSVSVADLHQLTASEFLQFGDSVVHDLSYQLAWHFNRPLQGVYVAAPGYIFNAAGIPRKSLILEVDGEAIDTLDDMERALAKLADRQQATIRFVTMEQPTESKLRLVRMERSWFATARCKRDDRSGFWPCNQLAAGPEAVLPVAVTAKFAANQDKQLRQIARSLVLVNFNMPYPISGVSDNHYYGTGLVVDAERGFVVVDRNTIPEAMGDVRITIAGSVEIPAKVEFVHPLHNLTLLSYDPLLLGDTPIVSAKLSDGHPEPGQELRVVGLRPNSRLASQTARVASVGPLELPLSRSMRFRDSNIEVVSLVNAPGSFDGVLMDKRGAVIGLWSSFSFDAGNDVTQRNYGVLAELVTEMLAVVTQGIPLHSLELEMRQVPLSSARNFGLPDSWADQLSAHDPERLQLLSVTRAVAGSPAAELFQTGDLLLAIDGSPVTRFREVERAAQKDALSVTVLRNRREEIIAVDTVELDGKAVRRAVVWAGAVLQEPYRQMAAQRGIEAYGVFVAYHAFGSPASRYNLAAGARIVEVDGEAVANLDAFLAAVENKADREAVRLTLVAWNESRQVITLKLDNFYWPTREIKYADSWQTAVLENHN